MSSVVSGITKIFSSVGTGLAKLGTAVKAVGASFFSAGGSSAGSLFSSAAGSTSTLGNIFSGIKSVLSIGPFGALGDAAATAGSVLTGGAAPTGLWKGLGNILGDKEILGSLIAGGATAWAKNEEVKAYEKMQQNLIDERNADDRFRRESYEGLPQFASTQAAVQNGVQPTATAATTTTPSNAYAQYNETKEKEIWAYNPETGMVEKKKVSRQPAATSMVA